MKLWEIITTIRDMGGTMEDVRALMQAGVMEESGKKEAPEAKKEEVAPEMKPEQVDPVQSVDNYAELEALRLENATLKGQLQTYNILHASMPDVPAVSPDDKAVQVGVDMIK